jgi:hypothetical protein
VVSGGIVDSRQLDAGGATSGNSGNITLEAPTIVLEDGSRVLAGVDVGSGFSAGDVQLIAERSAGGVAEIILGQGGGTSPQISGGNITLSATSTLDQASLLLALPTAKATITSNAADISASGAFTAVRRPRPTVGSVRCRSESSAPKFFPRSTSAAPPRSRPTV